MLLLDTDPSRATWLVARVADAVGRTMDVRIDACHRIAADDLTDVDLLLVAADDGAVAFDAPMRRLLRAREAPPSVLVDCLDAAVVPALRFGFTEVLTERDLYDGEQVRRTLASARARAERPGATAIADRRRLLAFVDLQRRTRSAHDLRAPIATASSALGAVSEVADLPAADRNRILSVADRALATAIARIDGLLDVTGGADGAGRVLLDPAAILDRVVEGLAPADRARLDVRRPDPGTTRIWAELVPFEHVLRVAVHNVVQHAGRTAAATRVVLHVRDHGDCVEVVLEDDGVGVQATVAGRVPVTATAGLGLLAADAAALAMGGTLELAASRLRIPTSGDDPGGLAVRLSVPQRARSRAVRR